VHCLLSCSCYDWRYAFLNENYHLNQLPLTQWQIQGWRGATPPPEKGKKGGRKERERREMKGREKGREKSGKEGKKEEKGQGIERKER